MESENPTSHDFPNTSINNWTPLQQDEIKALLTFKIYLTTAGSFVHQIALGSSGFEDHSVQLLYYAAIICFYIPFDEITKGRKKIASYRLDATKIYDSSLSAWATNILNYRHNVGGHFTVAVQPPGVHVGRGYSDYANSTLGCRFYRWEQNLASLSDLHGLISKAYVHVRERLLNLGYNFTERTKPLSIGVEASSKSIGPEKMLQKLQKYDNRPSPPPSRYPFKWMKMDPKAQHFEAVLHTALYLIDLSTLAASKALQASGVEDDVQFILYQNILCCLIHAIFAKQLNAKFNNDDERPFQRAKVIRGNLGAHASDSFIKVDLDLVAKTVSDITIKDQPALSKIEVSNLQADTSGTSSAPKSVRDLYYLPNQLEQLVKDLKQLRENTMKRIIAQINNPRIQRVHAN
eukprot:TRINITY_DN7730_c0_g1_i1.p1 TRINITY_DN7730_c0_g1~~TRINITY_DN7730_c0_g1_i1.p1  ORF type:complete len:405 (-),score=41.44 TRINITY_DN7730_c0_g1_i1:28-1242(-)